MILVGAFFLSVFASAQCSIDYTYYPVGVNYGLHPDTLPDGVVGQSYNQDLTFYLPLDTVSGGVYVEFTDFHITSISLPLGLTWECNNSSNACHYDPLVSQYGCVNVSGTPLVAGNYDVDVRLISPESLRIRSDSTYEIKKQLDFTESTTLEDHIDDLDVLYVTRIQKERFLDEEEYLKVKGSYVVGLDLLKQMKDDSIILHPLPRIDEISTDIDKTKNAKYFQQAEYGKHTRAALLGLILNENGF